MVNKVESSSKQLPNSINLCHEVFQLKLNILCSQAMTDEWIIYFEALELGEVLSDYFYPAILPSVCFQMSANILDISLRIWIRIAAEKNDNKSSPFHFCVNNELDFEVYLAGVERRIQQRSIFFCKNDGNFRIGTGWEKSGKSGKTGWEISFGHQRQLDS